jgi:hypothetical protein
MTNAIASDAEAAPGFFGILGNLYVAPSEAFAAILKRPMIWAPLLLAMALNAAFSVAWLQKVDGEAFMKARFAENPRARDMPADARAQAQPAGVNQEEHRGGIGGSERHLLTLLPARWSVPAFARRQQSLKTPSPCKHPSCSPTSPKAYA